MTSAGRDDGYDAVIVGSGFGGTMAAHRLVAAGQRVLLLERGGWVRRGPENWTGEGVGELTEHHSRASPYRVHDDAGRWEAGSYFCVGGPSVFYGGVSLRFRAEDFEHDPELAGSSGACWPYSYADLEPWYAEAERIIGVSGAEGEDRTEPWRSTPYPAPPGPLAPVSERIAAAARSLGFNPFRLPLAIDGTGGAGRTACASCGTCDGFACAIGAKNDLATAVLPRLVDEGLELRPHTVAVRLLAEGRRVTGVVCADARTGERTIVTAARYVLAAGALASPHLLLASGLQRFNPGGHTVGRYLMRHCNRIVFGVFPGHADPDGVFHKQLGIHDLYNGDPAARGRRNADLRGKLGALQQLPTPPAALVRRHLGGLAGSACAPLVRHVTGLLAIAEDQPQSANRVSLDPQATDRFGLPGLVVSHRYSARDVAAVRRLARCARAVLRRAGAWGCYQHRIATFSHAVGTVRMGRDPRTSALDSHCRFRGLDNLWVTDGSFMPTSAGVNPSLTIAANALRAAERIAADPVSTKKERASRALVIR
jgi:choline dehydrogenase-like flavoprotein